MVTAPYRTTLLENQNLCKEHQHCSSSAPTRDQMSLKSHDEGPDENMEEEEEEEVVSMSEEDLLKELDKQEPAFQV